MQSVSECVIGVVFIALAAPVLSAAQTGQRALGDAEAGMKFLFEQRCTDCHRVDGKGAGGGRDLGGALARGYSPAGLLSKLWDHSAGASPSFARMGGGRPHFTEADVQNLLAFALCRRYFERPGDAARGKRVFTAKRCATCHSRSTVVEPGAPPVASWTALAGPVALASDVWNPQPAMLQSARSKAFEWPRINSRELADLLVYLRNLPEHRGRRATFSAGSIEEGRRLYEAKGCRSCHERPVQRRGASARFTPADFVSSMWNHRCGRVPNAAAMDREEIRAIFSYLWSVGLFDEPASPSRGRRLFQKKGCAGCHGDGDAPPAGSPARRLRFGEMGPVAAAAALLNHGPGRGESAGARRIRWARLSPGQTADLIAFLSSPPSDNTRLASGVRP